VSVATTRKDPASARGLVSFPNALESTREGGMYVRLVVIDGQGLDWLQCAGGYHDVPEDGVFVGWGGRGAEKPKGGPEDWCYLLVATIGTTGWSGPQGSGDGYFAASYDDLTDGGKAFFDFVAETYAPEGRVYLQTWLDT